MVGGGISGGRNGWEKAGRTVSKPCDGPSGRGWSVELWQW